MQDLTPPPTWPVTDDELTDAWEACALGRGIAHEEHLRIAWTLVRRHGRDEGGGGSSKERDGTAPPSAFPNGFDEALSERWARALEDAGVEGFESFDELLEGHPELARSDLLGRPAWARER